jgi:hypothetical protein
MYMEYASVSRSSITCVLLDFTVMTSWQEYDERHPKVLAAPGSDGGSPPAQPMPEEFLVPPRSAAQDLMASLIR